MTRFEYRVVWRREGRASREARFYRLSSTLRRQERVATSDPHWRCDEGCGYPGVDTCDPPIVDDPRIERRTIGEWQALP